MFASQAKCRGFESPRPLLMKNFTMKIDTLIFDLDGTLLNTLGDLHACFNYAIKYYGYPERTLDEIKSFVGNGIKKAIQRALPYDVEDEKLNNIIELFKKYYQEHMYDLTYPYDGILTLLKELKDKGYKIAVVSNKYDYAVKELCEKYFKNYIDIAIGEGNGVRKKPNSDGIIQAIKVVNSDKNSTIYIGDSEVDIQTAKNIDIPCISVLWGFKDKDFLERHGAKVFAQTPNDIIKIIEKNLYLS